MKHSKPSGQQRSPHIPFTLEVVQVERGDIPLSEDKGGNTIGKVLDEMINDAYGRGNTLGAVTFDLRPLFADGRDSRS